MQPLGTEVETWSMVKFMVQLQRSVSKFSITSYNGLLHLIRTSNVYVLPDPPLPPVNSSKE